MDWWGWVLFFLIVMGGWEYGVAILFAVVGALTGRESRGPLSKKQVRQLQAEHNVAIDLLREIDAYDRYAASPLPSAIHERLIAYLAGRNDRYAIPGPVLPPPPDHDVVANRFPCGCMALGRPSKPDIVYVQATGCDIDHKPARADQ